MTRLIWPGLVRWSIPSMPYMSPAAMGCSSVSSPALAISREPGAERRKDGVRAAKPARRADRHGRAGGHQLDCLRSRQDRARSDSPASLRGW